MYKLYISREIIFRSLSLGPRNKGITPVLLAVHT